MKNSGREDKRVIDLLEGQLRAMIISEGLQAVASALNNACCHGEVFEEADIGCSDKALDALFEKAIDPLLKVSKKYNL